MPLHDDCSCGSLLGGAVEAIGVEKLDGLDVPEGRACERVSWLSHYGHRLVMWVVVTSHCEACIDKSRDSYRK